MKTSAPARGPKKLAEPPRSVMNTRFPEWVQYARVGSTLPVGVARGTPPTAACTAERTKAPQGYRGSDRPSDPAFRGFSRAVRRQRTNGEWTIRHITAVARTRRARE